MDKLGEEITVVYFLDFF